MDIKIEITRYNEDTSEVISKKDRIIKDVVRVPKVGEAIKTLMSGNNIITEITKVQEIKK